MNQIKIHKPKQINKIPLNQKTKIKPINNNLD